MVATLSCNVQSVQLHIVLNKSSFDHSPKYEVQYNARAARTLALQIYTSIYSSQISPFTLTHDSNNNFRKGGWHCKQNKADESNVLDAFKGISLLQSESIEYRVIWGLSSNGKSSTRSAYRSQNGRARRD